MRRKVLTELIRIHTSISNDPMSIIMDYTQSIYLQSDIFPYATNEDVFVLNDVYVLEVYDSFMGIVNTKTKEVRILQDSKNVHDFCYNNNNLYLCSFREM